MDDHHEEYGGASVLRKNSPCKTFFSRHYNNDGKKEDEMNKLPLRQLSPELPNTDAATMQSPPGATKDDQEHQVKLRTREGTLQEPNISHRGKRKIIFKSALVGNILVPWRVYFSR